MTKTAVAADFVSPKLLRVIALEQTVNDLMGYVSLWNTVRPIVEAARAFMTDDYTWNRKDKGDPGPALIKALAEYDALYPEHRR